MLTILQEISFWHWWIVAVVFIVLEMLAPGIAFLWLSIAAALVGAVLLAAPQFSWEYQLALFAILSVISMVCGRLWLRKHPTVSDRPDLNMRGAQYIGRRFELVEPIVNGIGKVRVGDTQWRVSGNDMPPGGW